MKRQTVVALFTAAATLICGAAGFYYGYHADKSHSQKVNQYWGTPYQLTITRLGPFVHGFAKNPDTEETYPVELRLDSIRFVSPYGNISTMKMAMDTSFPLGYTHKAYRDRTGFSIPSVRRDDRKFWYISGGIYGLLTAIVGGVICGIAVRLVDGFVLARQIASA